MAAPLVVEPERSSSDRREFLAFPYRLYRGHPVWVPPVRATDAVLMDRRKNPFFRHAEAQHFLARRGGRVVGRVAAIENRAHNEFHGDRLGFFGWFDVEPDAEAATALVQAAAAWCRARGLAGMRGPVNYSTNDSCGVLVEGFERPPMILMPWNREDYDALLRGAGLVPVKDLVAYWIPTSVGVPERMARLAKRALERSGVTLRPLDMRRFADEVDLLWDLYNRCWERNWGFVPMTAEEFRHSAKDLKFLVDPEVFLVAERGGKAVGFVGGLPDLNETLHGLDGRLFPLGLLKILRRKRRIRGVRVFVLGVAPEARGKGVDSALFVASIEASARCGYSGGEASWILEDNLRMRHDVEATGAKLTKRYRLYQTP